MICDMKVTVFILQIFDLDVMSFRHYPLVGMSKFYIEFNGQIILWSMAVKWLTVKQHSILECLKIH